MTITKAIVASALAATAPYGVLAEKPFEYWVVLLAWAGWRLFIADSVGGWRSRIASAAISSLFAIALSKDLAVRIGGSEVLAGTLLAGFSLLIADAAMTILGDKQRIAQMFYKFFERKVGGDKND